MPMTKNQPWRPPRGPDVEALEAGVRWDSARVPADLGAAVLAGLGNHTGAVIYDPYGQHLYWLTIARATDRWKQLPGIELLGAATYVGVPPPPRIDGYGVRWLIPLGQRYLTDPQRLYAALAEAVETMPAHLLSRSASAAGTPLPTRCRCTTGTAALIMLVPTAHTGTSRAPSSASYSRLRSRT